MKSQFVFASAKDRKNLAGWLARIPAERASALLAAFGARSVQRLHPSHFASVAAGVRRELAAKSAPAQEREAPSVSLFSLADTIHATVADIRQRDKAKSEEHLAPLRAAVEDAEQAYKLALAASDDAYAATRAAHKEMRATGERVYPAYLKAFDRQNGSKYMRAEFDSAVTAYDRAYDAEQRAKAAHEAANDRKEAAREALDKAARVRDAAREALHNAEG
jgi:hypothetical protein